MLALDMSAPAYMIDEAKHSMCWSRRVVGGGSSENAGECRKASEVVGERRRSMSVRRDVAGDRP